MKNKYTIILITHKRKLLCDILSYDNLMQFILKGIILRKKRWPSKNKFSAQRTICRIKKKMGKHKTGKFKGVW